MKEEFLIQFAYMMVSFSGIGKKLRQAKKRTRSLEKEVELYKRKFESAKNICRRSLNECERLEKENVSLWELRGLK
jgi:hypothetical protein